MLARGMPDTASVATAPGYIPLALRPRLVRAIRERGLRPVAGDFARWGTELLLGLPWTLQGSHGAFSFAGRCYPYRFHPYKRSWLTERAVEVPIAQALVDGHTDRRIIEIGNVLSHYAPQSHTIVDKYEEQPGVLNLDVFDLEQLGQFDLVVVISTIEHVGRDEEPQDPELAVKALHALDALVAPGGRLLLTVPIGYHYGLDAALRDGSFPFTRTSALRRVGATRWEEVSPETVWHRPYDFLLYAARAVFVAEYEKPVAAESPAQPLTPVS